MIKKVVLERKKILKHLLLVTLGLLIIIAMSFTIGKVFNLSFALMNYMGTDEWYKDYTYTISDTNKTITLTKYDGSSTEVTIPSDAIIDSNNYQTVIRGGVFQDRNDITKITFNEGVKASTSLVRLFSNCTSLSEINFNNFDTSATTNMNYMFYHTYSLESVDLSNFNTSNVTNMENMFRETGLTSLNLSSFNTENVTSMNQMFYQSNSLAYLDMSSFDTTNVTSMGTMYPPTAITKIKIGPKTDFKTSESYTAGSFGRGTWIKEEDGLEYSAIDVSVNSSSGTTAGTYTKISNYIEEMNVHFPVTYKIEQPTKIDRYETTNNNLQVIDDTVVIVNNLTRADTDDYQVLGKITLYFNKIVSDSLNNKYNLKMTIDNIHLYDIDTEEDVSTFIHRMLVINQKFSLGSYYYPDTNMSTRVYSGSSSAIDVTFEIVDDNENEMEGTYIFSAYDLDISSKRDKESSYPEIPNGYGYYSEGVNLLEGFNMSTLKMAANTFLIQLDNRITGTRSDTSSELSEFVIQGNAQKTKFTWTGQGCATSVVSQYQPKTVKFEKQNSNGEILAGAELELYYGNELIENWTSGSTSKEIFLNPGEYTLKEINAPIGYKKASNLRFSVGEDLLVKGKTVEKIILSNDPKSYSYTIYHVEKGNESNILETETKNADYKSTVEVKEKSFQGFIFDNKPKDNIIIDTENNIAYIYYTRSQYNYTVNYYDKESNELLSTNTINASYGQNVTVSDVKIEINKYTYDSSDKESIIVGTESSNNVLNLYYLKKSGKVVVKYLNQLTNEEISTSVEMTGKVDTSYQTSSKDISGYKLVGNSENTSGNYTENDIEVKYFYQKEVKIVVNHIDKTTNEVIEKETSKGYVGDSFTGSSKSFNKYKLVESPTNETITLVDGDNVLNYYYQKEVEIVVNHIDKTTNEVIEKETSKGYVGESFTGSSKSFDKYKLVESPTNETITLVDGDNVLNYYYQKEVDIVVNHIDKTTNEVIEKETAKGYVGESFTGSSKNINGYILIEKPLEETIVLNDENNILNYLYVKISAGVIEKHIDIYSEEILENAFYEGNVGDKYKVNSKKIDGYDLVTEKLPTNSEGTMTTEAIEVIYYYKKKTNVTIKYIDKETGKNILETEIIHGHSGDEYTTTEKEIHDYQIVNISGKKSGKMENSDIEVIYYYEKIRGHSPQTGDNRNIVLWTTLCFVGLIGSIIVLIYMIKKRKNK